MTMKMMKKNENNDDPSEDVFYKNTINGELFRGLLRPPNTPRLDEKYINDVKFVYVINEQNRLVWIRFDALTQITREEYNNAKQH